MKFEDFVSVSSCLIVTCFCFGCSPQAEIRQYTTEAETERIVTSDALRDQFGAIPFDWKAPESWEVADNDQFSKVAWEIGTKPDHGRITVSAVGVGMGIGSQLTRWRGQIGIEQSEPEDPMAGAEQLDLGDAVATYVDFEGEEQSILGMMLRYDGKLWVFKFRGSNVIAEKERDDFRSFCESVRISS